MQQKFGFASGSPQFIVSKHNGDFSAWSAKAQSLTSQVIRSDFQAPVGSSYQLLAVQNQARGIEMVPVLVDHIRKGHTQAQVEADAQALIDRVTATVYAKPLVIELGNEPNGPQYGGTPDPTEYVTLATYAINKLRTAWGSTVHLSVAGLAQYGATTSTEMKPEDFLNAILDLGFGSLVDGYSLHTEDQWAWSTLRINVRNLLVSRGEGGKPLHITENDVFTTPGTGSAARTEAQQADLIRGRIAEHRQASWGGYWCEYSMLDAATGSTNAQDNYGVLKRASSGIIADATEKLGAQAFRDAVAGAGTFGKTTTGVNLTSNSGDFRRGSVANLPVDGRCSRFSVYLGIPAGTGTEHGRCLAYRVSDDVLVATSNELTFDSTMVSGVFDFPLPATVDLPAGDYRLEYHNGPSGGTFQTQWAGDTVGVNTFFSRADTYAGGADATNGANQTGSPNRTMTIFMTYTPLSTSKAGSDSGSGSATATRSSTIKVTDTGTGVDTITSRTQIQSVDTGHAVESASVVGRPEPPAPAPPPSFFAEVETEVEIHTDEMGKAVYAGMEPLTYDEAHQFWALREFVYAAGQAYEEIWQIVRDQFIDGKLVPGWSILVDLDRTPKKALPWLAQFVGVSLPRGLTSNQMRDYIRRTDGWRRGTPAAMEGAARPYLTGDKTVIFRERLFGAYRVTVITRTYETPNPQIVLEALLSQKPAGLVLDYHVVNGRTWLEVREENANWLAARNNYGDWETMRATRTVDVPPTEPLVPSETLVPSPTLAPGG